MIRARIEPKLKNDAEKVFLKLGLSSSEAIQLFYAQVKLHRGLPFLVSIPNKTTLETIHGADNGKNIVRMKDAKDIFKKLGI